MNNNHLAQVLQHGFHVAVGAITSFLETAQNPEARTEILSEWQMELNQKTREWAVKGEITEQEARRILDNFLQQQNWQNIADYGDRLKEKNQVNFPVANDVNYELQQLKEDIVALRIELAKMRDSKD